MNNLPEIYEEFIKGKRITTDSRDVRPNDVFIALKGENFDGNRFAADALKAGAALAVVDHLDDQLQQGYLRVPDTLLFLQQLAQYHRHRLGIPILGITGTNGKTTTKELCNAVLSSRYKTFATQGNYNNHIGVPLTLLAMDESVQIGIVEMGANHPGEIKQLCEIADPDFGIITNIGQAHLEGFGCYENIIATKKQLYDHIRAKKGKLFVNADDPLLTKLAEGQEIYTYGTQGKTLKGEIEQTIPYLVYVLKTLQGNLYIRTHLTGGYNFDNAMAASCVGKYFDVPLTAIRDALENYHPSNMRSQLLKTEKNILILDAYNANPSSMKVALANFSEMKADNKVVILGEMLELGKESASAHADLLATLSSSGFQKIFLVGNSFEHCANNYNFMQHFRTTEALIEYLKDNPLTSCYIFIKGSRGNKLERITEYL